MRVFGTRTVTGIDHVHGHSVPVTDQWKPNVKVYVGYVTYTGFTRYPHTDYGAGIAGEPKRWQIARAGPVLCHVIALLQQHDADPSR